jgi:hypothetical protein
VSEAATESADVAIRPATRRRGRRRGRLSRGVSTRRTPFPLAHTDDQVRDWLRGIVAGEGTTWVATPAAASSA